MNVVPPAESADIPARPLRVLIADDELLARKRLARLLSAIPSVEILGECANGEETLQRVRDGGVDVVLLDIQMPGLSGIEAGQLMPNSDAGVLNAPFLVYCTAHPDHAVTAYELGAVDYVLKPVDAGRLQRALERARRHLANRSPPAGERVGPAREPAPRLPLQRLALPTRKGIVLLDPDGISHAVLENELVNIHSDQGEFSTDLSLQDLHDRLPKDRFERVHRKALLNLAHVARLEPLETGGLIARTIKGKAIVISRQVARDLRKRLGIRKENGEDD